MKSRTAGLILALALLAAPLAAEAQQATSTIPIVLTVSEELLAEGLVASLGRPGGLLIRRLPSCVAPRAPAGP